ncbi:MAG: hypothetical protein JXB49_06305 [Bacteroidales bacterium]|nr:hypothetical protein [Bacteroidales bacterium]
MAKKDVLKGRSIVNKNIFNQINKREDIIDKITKEHEYLEQQKEETPLDLNAVIDFYHKKLYENSEALNCLEKLGLKKQANYERFKIGYADESILNSLSKKQIELLKKLGLIGENDVEYFINCIIFPIFNENGKVVCIYGLDINTNEFLKPVYLNSEIPIFNEKALKVYDEVFLTENILEALNLIELEIENVISINDSGNITARHIKLLQDNRVKTIILAIKNEITADALKDLFVSEGFRIKTISFYKPQSSINEALQKDQVTRLIEEAELFKPEEDKTTFKVHKDGFKYTFLIGEASYIVTGLKELFVSNLRVNIKAEYQGEWYPDNLDLYSARSRTSFSQTIGQKFNIEPTRIEKDLLKILEYFENERDRALRVKEDKEEELTEEEKEIGLKFLKSPDLFNQIVNDMTTLGYVGEELNKQLLYLCASSRKLDDPISVLIISQSASGKSYLVETVRRLMPQDEVVSITSLSDQALNYIESLLNRFLIFGEAVHSDIIEHQIREMLSSKELTRLVTLKDEKTGKLKSELVKKKVIVSTVLSTTNHRINPENASRYFIINADESREQTRKIHELQRKKYSLEEHYKKMDEVPDIVRKHQIAQKLLRKVIIINSFARYLNFPDSAMRTRRDHDRFIDLIAVVCFLRQYQKELKNDGRIDYIECDLTDYEVAYNIMVNGVLSSTMIELPKGAMNLYEEVRKMAKKIGKENNLNCEEVSFSQRELREYSKFNADSIKKYLKVLVDYEYIQVNSGKNRGTRFLYKLRKDESIENIDLSIIPAPKDMKDKLKI